MLAPTNLHIPSSPDYMVEWSELGVGVGRSSAVRPLGQYVGDSGLTSSLVETGQWKWPVRLVFCLSIG
jgi:hypothetical protein